MQTKEKKESACCPSCCSCYCHRVSSEPQQKPEESPSPPQVLFQSKRPYREYGFSAETIEEIRELRRKGWSLEKIAQRIGTTTYGAHKYSYDIPSCKVVTQQESERMKQLAAEGHDTKTIVAITGLSPSTVNKHTYHIRGGKSRRPRRPL